MRYRFKLSSVLLFVGILACCGTPASAGVFEISLGCSYNRSNYSDRDYSWSRKLGAGIGYHISEKSQIELAFQDIFDRTKIDGYEDTSLHDRIYSLNWVQSLIGKNFPIQPYVKIGIGQLNRDAEGTYLGGNASPPVQMDSVTVVLGAGLRLYVLKNFAIRSEATSYLTGGNIRTYKDNVSLSVGASFYF